LAGLYRQWVDAPDVSAVADFFRVSPWSAREMDVALSQFVMHDLIQRAESSGKTYTVYVSIDDSLTGKDKDTKSLETVDWHHDHDASTKKKATYCNGAVHISCRVQIAECSYTFAWRMYLREKTVRRLNRKRSKHQRVKFQTKYIKRQGKSWHVLCAIKYNRTIDGIQVCVIDQNFRHKHYTKVEVKAADRTTTYYTRKVQGHLSDVPFPVCVIISRRHPRDKSPKYFLCTDLTLSAQTILNWYQRRWPIEVDYWYLKQRLGLGDFRLHSYEAIHRWYSVVYLTFSFLQWQLYEARASGQPLSSVADVIKLKKAEHAREVLIAACKEAIACGEVEPVVERFINPLQMAA
jgi:IS4 transposase